MSYDEKLYDVEFTNGSKSTKLTEDEVWKVIGKHWSYTVYHSGTDYIATQFMIY